MNYVFHLAIFLAIYAIAAVGLNIVVGYCGMLTMAHGVYFALGCYAYALAVLNLHWNFALALVLALGVGVLLSLFVSLPSWRFRGDFFILVSLSVQVLLFSLMTNWFDQNAQVGTLRNLTNGSFGIGGIPRPTLLGYRLDALADFAILSGIVAAVSVWLCRQLLNAPWGRLLKAMRDDELAARGLGKNVRWAKIQALALACGMAAIAGALYAAYVGYIDPSSGSLDQSMLMLCMVIVGGAGNVKGPLAGAAVLLALPELLRYLHMTDAVAANWRLLLFGALLTGMMHFRPQGLAGEYRLE